MIVCGLKLTHDGALAIVEDGALIASVEVEKLDNRGRYSDIGDLALVSEILDRCGYAVADVDHWVIDGWDGEHGRTLQLLDHGAPVRVRVGPYRESASAPCLLQPALDGRISLGGSEVPYSGYTHVAGHLASTYCTSPFAAAGEPAFVLVWDGGLFPRLYLVDPRHGVQNGGALFPLIGHAYAMAGLHFGPFVTMRQETKADELSIAGKLMAYIALGTARPSVLRVIRTAFHETFEGDSPAAQQYRRTIGGFGSLSEPSRAPVDRFYLLVGNRVDRDEVPDEDILASIHQFLQELLVERLEDKIRTWKGGGPWNLCLAGGCALNIKWNSAIRDLALFDSVWVPPFPNDAGSALGAAMLGAMSAGAAPVLRWELHTGPELNAPGPLDRDWTARPADAEELARVLHTTGRPVVLLQGRAELGPRALGGRSIVAPPVDAVMKSELNAVKKREDYRPVAPVCLEEDAPAIFDPGTYDPYMLFDHAVRPEWLDRIPAVVHLDGTARLQTVSRDDAPFMTELLSEYRALSGVPVLCNTSANLNGSGFFPDVDSAIEWGQIERVWSDGVLYEHVGPGER